MGDLTKNLSWHEFACKGEHCCGHSAPISLLLVQVLQLLRNKVEIFQRAAPKGYRSDEFWAFHVRSGFRCLIHNCRPRSEGGAGSEPNSKHPLGLAADIALPKAMTADDFFRLAVQVPEFAAGGIGVYHDFLHLDIRPDGPARWDDRVEK